MSDKYQLARTALSLCSAFVVQARKELVKTEAQIKPGTLNGVDLLRLCAELKEIGEKMETVYQQLRTDDAMHTGDVPRLCP